MSEKLIYLAGPITGLSFEDAANWRDSAEKFLKKINMRGLSPIRGKEYLLQEGVLKDHYNEHFLSKGKTITRRDRFDCTRADMILMNLLDAKTVSIGTMIEIGWADANRIPIVLVMEDDNIHRHSMVEECADYRVKTLTEALALIKVIL